MHILAGLSRVSAVVAKKLQFSTDPPQIRRKFKLWHFFQLLGHPIILSCCSIVLYLFVMVFGCSCIVLRCWCIVFSCYDTIFICPCGMLGSLTYGMNLSHTLSTQSAWTLCRMHTITRMYQGDQIWARSWADWLQIGQIWVFFKSDFSTF